MVKTNIYRCRRSQTCVVTFVVICQTSVVFGVNLIFSGEMEDSLIKLVKSREVLYNKAHQRYFDAKYKNAIWREIGDTLNRSRKCFSKKADSVFIIISQQATKWRRDGNIYGERLLRKWKYPPQAVPRSASRGHTSKVCCFWRPSYVLEGKIIFTILTAKSTLFRSLQDPM